MRATEDPQHLNILTDETHKNIYEQLDAYYLASLKRCEPNSARNMAINRLKADIEELITNWEISKS